MPQLSLYLSDENLDRLRTRSRAAGVSMSKYASMLIERDVSGGGWPAGLWDLYGSIADDSFAEPPDPIASDDAEFEQMFS